MNDEQLSKIASTIKDLAIAVFVGAVIIYFGLIANACFLSQI